MSKKKKIGIICSSLLLILCISVVGVIKYKQDQKKEDEQTYIETEDLDGVWYIQESPELTSVKWLNHHSWLLLTQKEKEFPDDTKYKDNKRYVYNETAPIIGTNKIITYEIERYINYKDYRKTYSKNCIVTVYTIDKNKLKKEKQFDLNKILQKTEKGSSAYGGVANLTQNEEYISFAAGNDEIHYLRLADEKIFKESEMPQEVLQEEVEYETEQSNLSIEYEIFANTNVPGGYLNNSKYGVRVNIVYPKQFLRVSPSKGEKPLIIKKYPEIKHIYEKKEKGTIRYIKNPPSAQELIDLSVPKGVNPWKNVKLKGSYSKSGQDEKITSLEDFVEKYQPRE